MATYVLRVWLPDRPGALGSLTSALGAVGGNLSEIQILERVENQAIDELTIELHDDVPIQWLMQELDGIAGLVIEDARRTDGGTAETILDAVEVGAKILNETSPSAVITDLTNWVVTSFTAQWVAAVLLDPPSILASLGPVPEQDWLMSFIAANPSAGELVAANGAPDLIWASLDAAGIGLVVGRSGRPFRARERRHLAALGTIAGLHWMDYSWAQ